jgi:isoquinoline 1-oxidoreductase beta subunit
MSEGKKKMSRRRFLVTAGLTSAGVMGLGTYLFRDSLRRVAFEAAETTVTAYSGTGTEVTLWFEVTKENRVTFHSPKVEMGQGAFTGLAQIISDELDVDVAQIDVVAAATETGIVDGMSTGGSLSIASLWTPLRELAATMREMIKAEAASQMGADVASLTTKSGVVTAAGGKTRTYAEVAAGVGEWSVPSAPPLREVSSYASVGKPVPRVDLAPKVFGDPIFGMDAELPDMLHAVIARPSILGAKLGKVDSSKAAKMPGVVDVIERDDWVAVVAQTYPQALAAKYALSIEWDAPKVWTEQEIRDMLRVGKGNEMLSQTHGGALDPGDPDVVTLEFTSPMGAHAQIEPNGAVADVRDGEATIILSTQVVGITRRQVAEALGFAEEKVNVVPTYLGGGFGRRLDTSHAVQAALISKAVGKPVKYFFRREEEFQHDMVRPPTHHVMRGKLGADGAVEALEHHYASGDVAVNSLLMPPALYTMLNLDLGAARGAHVQYDGVPNRQTVQWHTTLPFATSWWRSLGLLANTFAIESFVDELALEAGADPVEFRLKMLSGEGNSGRIAAVLEKAAEVAGYTDGVADGRAMGVAASIDANAPCAHVVEVSVEGAEIKVHKVVCVLDSGLIVNPDLVRAQCEGNVLMGMSAALYEEMTIEDGELQPSMYGPYEMLRMRHTPREIEVHFVQGADHPLPVGEPPMGPIAAAIANAVRRITGERLTNLPLRLPAST